MFNNLYYELVDYYKNNGCSFVDFLCRLDECLKSDVNELSAKAHEIFPLFLKDISNGINILKTDCNNFNAFHHCAEMNLKAVFSLLFHSDIKHPDDDVCPAFNRKNADGNTPLMIAIQHGNYRIATDIIQCSSDSVVFDYDTILIDLENAIGISINFKLFDRLLEESKLLLKIAKKINDQLAKQG